MIVESANNTAANQSVFERYMVYGLLVLMIVLEAAMRKIISLNNFSQSS
jgi:hypothetical protein